MTDLFIKLKKSNSRYLLAGLIVAVVVGAGVLSYADDIFQEMDSLFFFPRIRKPEKAGNYLRLFDDLKEDLMYERTDFLEVNLAQMKVNFYKDGSLLKEFEIKKKGNPQEWGGSAAGLYKILSGYKSSFSVVAEVYMPFALNYYGKYYIHGDPYYLDGAIPEYYPNSGGCINLSDKDAEAVYQLTEIDMPVLVIDKERDNYKYPKEKLSEISGISAKSYLAADLDSGYIFSQKDIEKQLPLASLTKLMTAVVVAENVNLRESVFTREEMINGYGATDGLVPDKEFRVVELFYPLLTESSNDCAGVLGYFLGPKRTVNLMNQKAEAILMEATNFVDTSGYDPENVSTARDIFHLLRYIFYNRPPILEISKGNRVVSFGEVKFDIENLWNKNIFIHDPTFVGGKTGFIEDSKGTAAFIFNFETSKGEQRNIAIILLGSNNVESDTQRIYIWLQKKLART